MNFPDISSSFTYTPAMSSTRSIVIATFVAILVALGAADAFIAERPLTASLFERAENKEEIAPDVLAVIKERGLEAQDSAEESLLAQVAEDPPVQTRAILANDDRARFIAWIVTPEAPQVFTALKDALLRSFSANVTDLRDERSGDDVPVSILTFRDSKLGEERFVFVQMGPSLYELHVAAMQEEQIFGLIESLTSHEATE